MVSRFVLSALIGLGLVIHPSPSRSEATVGTFSLDALSFISFGDQRFLMPGSGSFIRFQFGEPAPDGSVPFTIEPQDVSIAPIPVDSSGRTLRYAIVSTASGVMRTTAAGRTIEFTATVRATLDNPNGSGSYDYTMPFTTEAAAASDLAGTETLSVTGMRLIEGVWYGQIVGATTNKANAFPEPGAAVYTVLSGQFDQLP